jgi:Family of unknown function (DUF6279)
MSRSIHPLAYPLRIIGVLLLVLLTACSAVKIGYNNAPTLSYWWLDNYIDFNDEQAPLVRERLDTFLAWHRQSELPAYVDSLRNMQQLADGNVTTAQVCGLWSEVQTHIEHLGIQAAGPLSSIVPTIKPEQLRYLGLQFDKRNQKWRDEWIDLTRQDLLKHRLKLATERAEMLYGRLHESQRNLLRQSIEQSRFDAQLVYRDKLRQQQDILQILREHSQSQPLRPTHVQAEVLALLERMRVSPDPLYRAQQETMRSEGCTTLAALHNSSNKEQRASLLQTLKDYEADARTLGSTRN